MQAAEKFQDNTLFHIDGVSGRDVDALSVNRGEAEILFDKGTAFDVVKKVQHPDGHWEIHLKEKP